MSQPTTARSESPRVAVDAEKNSPVERSADPAAPSPRPRRRRWLPRFGLRTLLILGVVASLLLGVVGRQLYRIRREAAATERLVQSGARIRFDFHDDRDIFNSEEGLPNPLGLTSLLGEYAFARPTVVTLSSAEGAGDADVAALAEFSKLHKVQLDGEAFTDASIEGLGRIDTLERLFLRDTRITGSGLAKLANRENIVGFDCSGEPPADDPLVAVTALPNLSKELFVERGPVNCERMLAVTKLKKLETLYIIEPTRVEPSAWQALADCDSIKHLMLARLDDLPFGDDALRAIADMESLEILVAFPLHDVSDAGIAELTRLSRLVRVEIAAPRMTDVGAEAISRIPTLEVVELYDVEITESGLAAIGRLPRLEYLCVNSSIDVKAARRFADDHPNCRVTWLAPDGLGSEVFNDDSRGADE